MGQARERHVWRCPRVAFSGLGLGLFLAAAGCGGSNAGPAVDAGKTDADFAACASADAAPYMAGVTTASKSGAAMATIDAVTTTNSFGPPVDAPAVGLSTFTMKITDPTGGALPGLTVTANKPYMPAHGHYAPTVPAVTDQGGGMFVISQIDFFMHGYFELTLNLQMSSGSDGGGDAAAASPDAGTDGGSVTSAPTTDRIVLPICVPS
jgi:hypothetical protein